MDYLLENINNNRDVYNKLNTHITMLKNMSVLTDDATAQIMKILEEIFITINDDNELLKNELTDENVDKIIDNQKEQHNKLKKLILDFGYSDLNYIIQMIDDDNEFRNKYEWLNKYFTCYDVKTKDLVFYDTDINVSFLPNKNKLLIKSFLYTYNTCVIKIVINTHEITLKGFFNYDQNPIYNEPYYAEKYNNLFHNTISDIDEKFRIDYLSNYSNVDFVLHDEKTIIDNMKKHYIYANSFTNNTIEEIVEKFEVLTSMKQREIIVLLLLLDEKHHIMANTLFENYLNFSQQDMRLTLFWALRKRLKEIITFKQTEKNKIIGTGCSTLSFEEQILLLDTSQQNKSKALSKVKELGGSKDNVAKAENYLLGFCKIPFGVYKKEDIFIECEQFDKDYNCVVAKIQNIDSNIKMKRKYSSKEIKSIVENIENPEINNLLKDISIKHTMVKIKKKDFLNNVRQKLNNIVYGQELVKNQLEMIFAQWLNGKMNGSVIGICGPPGTGKTEIIKNGLSKCLKDNNDNLRPFVFIPLGGARDSAEFKGHGYTYQNSQWGSMVSALIDSKCMNPIIFFDELDKISETEFGRDVINLFIHLTDPTQNDDIKDKYFAGVSFDFSKCLIIFSYNNRNILNKILKERITELTVKSLTVDEKVKIITNFTCPKLCKEVGVNDIKIPDEIIKYIINTYTCEAGIRKLIEKIVEIIRYINLCELNDEEWEMNIEFIDKVLERFNRPIPSLIHDSPCVGVVNGLYASESGLGGITKIQLNSTLGSGVNEILKLKLTGRLGEVMQESAECARTLAWSLLSEDIQNELTIKYKESNTSMIHLHCPDGSVPKDGPSAGITLTLAIYSFLTGRKIYNTIAMTGEVDILGNVKAIGGLDAKLNGAIMAGCTKVLIPKENIQDFERLNSDIKNNLEIIQVSNINQVLEHALLEQ